MSFGVIVGGNHKSSKRKKGINSAYLKKPILDRVSPDKSSNQLRYTETVMQLTPDVHV
jgi:hypothetical protein